jgi:sensor histidine kinase regulating citrate/malate metabolism
MKISNSNKIIVILGLAVILIVLGFYYQYYLQGEVPTLNQNFIIYTILMVILTAASLSLILTNKLLVITKQEKVFEQQRYHIEQLQEMNKIIKTQRHDFVNHMQTIYGLMQLGLVDEAHAFINELCAEVKISGEALRLAIPELSALLLVKTGVATSRNISFRIEMRSDLSHIDVRPFDLVAIMGNLINNAIEAVENLPVEERRVQIQVFENTGFFIMQIRNLGFIHPDLRTMIFTPGFSTKSDNKDRGLGLSSIKSLVEAYHGFVVVSSHPDKGSCFTVGFPKQIVKGR